MIRFETISNWSSSAQIAYESVRKVFPFLERKSKVAEINLTYLLYVNCGIRKTTITELRISFTPFHKNNGIIPFPTLKKSKKSAVP